jgi:hypothetical protein
MEIFPMNENNEKSFFEYNDIPFDDSDLIPRQSVISAIETVEEFPGNPFKELGFKKAFWILLFMYTKPVQYTRMICGMTKQEALDKILAIRVR